MGIDTGVLVALLLITYTSLNKDAFILQLYF